MYYLTIDAGTTNTRATLWSWDKQALASHKDNTGVRNTAIDGDNAKLKEAVKKCIDELTINVNIKDCIIIAAGMITSNVGLFELAHNPAPSGKKEFAEGMRKAVIEDVCDNPIWFIPGLKNHTNEVKLDELEYMDILRGEEVESIAMLSELKLQEDCIFVLTGSHTKFIPVNSAGQLLGCYSTLTGELLEAVTNYTILADATGKEFVQAENYNKDILIKGYDDASRLGAARAFFQVRIMSQFTKYSKQDIANYLMGAALAGDIQSIGASRLLNASKEKAVITAGKAPLINAFTDLLRHAGYTNVTPFPHTEELSGKGAIEIYLEREAQNGI